MKHTGKNRDDERVTAPLISWKVMLAIFVIMYFLVVAQAFIVTILADRVSALVTTLVYYLIVICLILTIFFGIFWRYVIGKPLRRITNAARKVAAGDFSIQIDPVHKNGKQNEIDVLIEDFNKMTRELAGNEVLKNDFIANVSHEIKTPLSIIQSYTKALKDPELAPELREQYTDTVIAATKNLNAMITNILKLNKLEHQEIYPKPEPYQLGEQLRRCALGFMDSWQAKEIDFTIDVEDVVVCYDESLLELVWNNLLSNAIKYTDAGGSVALVSWREGSAIFVQVKDSGCGISREVRDRIFDKFYQADTSHSSEGNGLGLALAKKALDVAGVEIAVESEPNKGSAFTVRLEG